MSRKAERAKAALERSLARDQWKAARRHLTHVRGLVKSARKARAVEIRAVVARCRAARTDLRARLKAERVRALDALRAQVAHEREAVRLACIAARTLAAEEGAAHVARAKEALDEAERAERAHRENIARARASRVDVRPPRSSAAERRSESDDEVRANIQPELAHLFEAVKGKIAASPRMSRTEAFLKYAEEHAGEALEAAQDKADTFVKEHERAERAAAAAYKAAERAAKRPSARPPPAPASSSTPYPAEWDEPGPAPRAASMPPPRHGGAVAPAGKKPRKPSARAVAKKEREAGDAAEAARLESYRAKQPMRLVVFGVPDAHEGAHGWRVRDELDPAGVVANFSTRAAAVRAANRSNRGATVAAIRGAGEILRRRAKKPDAIARLAEDVGFLSGANLSVEERQRAIQAENDRNLPASVWRKREREAREKRDEERGRARRASEERADQHVTVAYADPHSGEPKAIVYATVSQDDLIRIAGEAKAWAVGAGAVFARPQVKAWPASRTTKDAAIREAIATYRRAPPSEM